jgi:galactose oxidase
MVRSQTAAIVALIMTASAASAQLKEVTVGVTHTCPHGINACWSGAKEAIRDLDGVAAVGEPDAYNCTAILLLKDSALLKLPDPAAWGERFQKSVGKAFVFRGVEATLQGTVKAEDKALMLSVPTIPKPIPLAKLRNKLQWNAGKKKARQPEPDEAEAFETLLAYTLKRGQAVALTVTGPILPRTDGATLEVREYFLHLPAK